MTTLKDIQKQLIEGYIECSKRGLFISAKWAAELLPYSSQSISLSMTCAEIYYKSLLDVREYAKLAAQIREIEEHRRSVVEIFLMFYAEYLLHQQKRESKENLNNILQQIEKIPNKDSFLFYLHGVILNKLDLKKAAQEALTQSVKIFPTNWSAWIELSLTLTQHSDIDLVLKKLDAKHHFIHNFFWLYASVEWHNPVFPLSKQERCIQLDRWFPDSAFILAQYAISAYHHREYDEAQILFANLQKKAPMSVAHMDIYSNILFVKEDLPTLSLLAHSCASISKYSPETCCVIGNYFSLRGNHVKAVIYFRRALKLDEGYLAAWTLMGHEYLELRNTYGALEAYRRAIDVNSSDYRAWFGLAQTYEMLRMPFYALRYYQKSAALRPNDSRMWSALANVYEALEKPRLALQCLQRALSPSIVTTAEPQDDQSVLQDDVPLLFKIGKLYQKLGDLNRAETVFKTAADICIKTTPRESTADLIDALLFLVKSFCLQSRQFKRLKMPKETEIKPEELQTYLNVLLESNGPEREEAKSLMREIGFSYTGC